MQRYFIEIAYTGTRYHGWQKQKNAATVQEVVEDALQKVLINTPIKLVGASRTDAGVHARQNFAHFDRKKPPAESFLHRINNLLPIDILVKRFFAVHKEAHARFSAVSRSYEYIICTRKNPFMEGFAYQLYNKSEAPDVEAMNDAASLLSTYKDFSTFCKAHTQVKTKICKIKEAKWVHYEDPGQLVFYITADRFLRGMVRGIVGTLLKVGIGQLNVDDFKAIIESKQRKNAFFDAPPEGLYLTEVKYPFKLPRR